MDKVIHFEIPADNPERAKKFYRDIFGWEFNEAEGEMEYSLIKTVAVDKRNLPLESGAINGGLTKRMSKSEAPVIVIDVLSIDERIKQVLKAGGKVVFPKRVVMQMGLYARVTDSEGNVIGLWETIKK
ncbi:MAG TPA: VOC family protein [Dehalococcoidales bacterium]|nr:VOC family protein [Dehalococcoidales bacterium]